MTWFGFLTTFEGPPPDPPDPHEGARHDLLLAGQGKALRVVEADEEVALDGLRLRCALSRHEQPADGGQTPSMWSGLIYPLKAGTEDRVADIFAESGRPDHEVKDDEGNVAGRLLRTLVFVGPEVAIRVIEVEGDLRTVSRHMSRQPQVKAFEREIEEHLAVPRDMVTPEGAESFFRQAGMRALRVTSAGS